jgi:Zn ribbon nucleic-acid-binding protein
MDKLVVDSENQLRECVMCGFQDRRPQQGVSELDTRVNRAAARLVETSAEPLRFAEPDQDED